MVTARRSRFFATVVARGRLVGQEDVPMTQPIGSGFCNPPSPHSCYDDPIGQLTSGD